MNKIMLLLFLIGILIGYYLGFKKSPDPTAKYEYYIMADTTGYNVFTNKWDGTKYSTETYKIGYLKYGENPTLDSLIDLDNQ